MAEQVELTIRCAHQSMNDQTVHCRSDWSVYQVKQHLTSVHPSKPAVSQQRLIYHGQLLKDEALLRDILRSYGAGNQHVFHLVYTPIVDKLRESAETPMSNATHELRRRNLASPSQPSSPVVRNQPVDTSAASSVPTPQIDFNAYNLNGQMNAEWAQQAQNMYAAYMANYMNYLQQIYGTFSMPGQVGMFMQPIGFIPGVQIPQTFANNIPPPADVPAGEANAQQRPAAAEPAMNAQGGLDQDEDFHERDWLDWLYMGSRAALLFMILYFYSSVERFFFVTVGVLLIYLYQNGWFGRRQAVGAGAPQGEAAGVPQPAQNNENRANDFAEQPPPAAEAAGEQPNENGNPVAPTPNAHAAQPNVNDYWAGQSAWTVFWMTCYNFVTGFFMSLIPQRPPPLEAAN